ncbi:aspartate/glutamate racemase family protein [Streptomyces thinghirensis]|nr:aspartate/glutamate racemase family protein [Streptomyces thinghirensis]
MDSGIGLLAATAAVRRLRPDADLIPLPGPRRHAVGTACTTEDLTERALAVAEAAAAHRPDVLIVGCNTATVHALPALRARLEPTLPVIGTVPAIKPAAAGGGPVAIWATPATTGSPTSAVSSRSSPATRRSPRCRARGLADAVEHADEAAITAAIAAAAPLTPDAVTTVVLGCTHYELVAERIRAAVQRPGAPRLVLHGSAGCRRRPGAAPDRRRPRPRGPRPRAPLTVLLERTRGTPPAPALALRRGRLLQRSHRALTGGHARSAQYAARRGTRAAKRQ